MSCIRVARCASVNRRQFERILLIGAYPRCWDYLRTNPNATKIAVANTQFQAALSLLRAETCRKSGAMDGYETFSAPHVSKIKPVRYEQVSLWEYRLNTM